MTGIDSKRPQRIQRKRAKGWRAPPGAVYVGRPTIFGNPFHVSSGLTAKECVDAFRQHVTDSPEMSRAIPDLLRGKDLMCWCAIGADHCHADVLLEIANG